MPPFPRRAAALLLALLGLAPLAAAPLAAQEPACQVRFAGGRTDRCAPRWVAHFAMLSGNALVGGVTGGIGQRLRGGSFRDGFARGAGGGAVLYGGKRIAAADFAGAGLLGRQVGAFGTAAVRNAAAGLPSLHQIAFPLGPVNLYLTRDAQTAGSRPWSGLRVAPKVNAAAAAYTLYALSQPELEWDRDGSLSAGAPVFRVYDRRIQQGLHRVSGGSEGDTAAAQGLTVAGVVLLSELRERGPFEQRGREYTVPTFAHERVHLVQQDFGAQLFAAPLADVVLRRVPGGRRLTRYVDLHLDPVLPLLGLLLDDPRDQPWELEAAYLGER